MSEKPKEKQNGEKKYLYAVVVMIVILIVSIPVLSYITVRNSEIIFHVYDTSNDTKQIVEEIHLTANATQKQASIANNQSIQNGKDMEIFNKTFTRFLENVDVRANQNNIRFNQTFEKFNELGNQTKIIAEISSLKITNEEMRTAAVNNITEQNNKRIDMAVEKICNALIKAKVIRTC